MEESSSDSSALEPDFPTSNIRNIEMSLLEYIHNLTTKISEESFLEVTKICEDIKEKILNYTDESNLSETQTTSRIINIASKLLLNICFLHQNNTDFEFTRAVNELLLVKKLNEISKKIQREKHLEKLNEEVFLKEAEEKLVEPKDEVEKAEDAAQPEVTLPRQVTEVNTRAQGTETIQDVTEVLGRLSLRSRNQEDQNVSQIRGDFKVTQEVNDIIPFEIERRGRNILTDVSQPDLQLQTSIRVIQDDLNRIHQTEFLADGDEPANDIMQSANVPDDHLNLDQERIQETTPAVQKIQDDVEIATIEDSDELKNLPAVESEEGHRRKKSEEGPQRKRRRLIMDKQTSIPDYAIRALRLNENVVVERVRVFEGPPTVVQALSSLSNLMTTPGYRISPFGDKRNKRLENLFSRHIMTEKRPAKELNVGAGKSTLCELGSAAETSNLKKKIRTEEQIVEDLQRVQPIAAVEEEPQRRVGLHSIPERRELLSEAIPHRLEETVAVNSKETERMEIPLVEEPPQPDRSIPPEIQQEKTQPEIQKSPPWFFSTKKAPPNEKWREFNYVTERLEVYWELPELLSEDKTINLREFLACEGGGNTADFFTLLRVLDKLSLEKKVVLICKDGDVYVQPFEIPYVSEGQYLLKETKAKF